MIALSTFAAAAVVWRFAMRARVGARVRALTDTKLRVSERAASALARVPAGRVVLAALGGAIAGGATMAFIGVAASVLADPLLRARAERTGRREMEEQLADVARAIASALRAGRNLPQAIEAALEDAPEPVRGPLDACVRRLSIGTPIDDALALFAARAGVPSADALAETIRIGRLAGSDLPAVLDVFATALGEREQIARDRRAATSQARMSAAVVACMPVAFFVLAGSGARTQLDVLTRTPVGWALLVVGLMLEAGGVLWMRALLRER